METWSSMQVGSALSLIRHPEIVRMFRSRRATLHFAGGQPPQSFS
jgi:hypothetical protein